MLELLAEKECLLQFHHCELKNYGQHIMTYSMSTALYNTLKQNYKQTPEKCDILLSPPSVCLYVCYAIF